jgi:hypothetical protein
MYAVGYRLVPGVHDLSEDQLRTDGAQVASPNPFGRGRTSCGGAPPLTAAARLPTLSNRTPARKRCFRPVRIPQAAPVKRGRPRSTPRRCRGRSRASASRRPPRGVISSTRNPGQSQQRLGQTGTVVHEGSPGRCCLQTAVRQRGPCLAWWILWRLPQLGMLPTRTRRAVEGPGHDPSRPTSEAGRRPPGGLRRGEEPHRAGRLQTRERSACQPER